MTEESIDVTLYPKKAKAIGIFILFLSFAIIWIMMGEGNDAGWHGYIIDGIFFVGALIIIPLPEFAFRVLLPSRWTGMKVQKIDRIMTNETKSPSDIRYLIDCLFPGYGELYERAGAALRDIGEPAVEHLICAYPYKAADEFGDFKTCVHGLIEEIGGKDAEEFLQSERENQDEVEQ